MVKSRVFIEGGGDSKELRTRCREGFRRLLESCGYAGKMPGLVACGSRGAAFDDFSTAHENADSSDFVAMLVDSEDPVADIEETWVHLKARDNWDKPAGANDDQVLLMTTCMETWIVSDRRALQSRYPNCLNENQLPAVADMESRSRASVQDALVRATSSCKNKYSKGKRSFEVLGQLSPDTLKQHLPSFTRAVRILDEKL